MAWWRWRTWSIEDVPPPWGERPSILAHLRGGGGEPLPDEDHVETVGGHRWAPGAKDGVLGHHHHPSDSTDLRDALLALLERSDSARAETVYRLANEPIVSVIDTVIEGLVESQASVERVSRVGNWLLHAADREPVKLGIALLGLTGLDLETADVLGAHDEFTLYVVVAVQSLEPHEAERRTFDLARRVDGWGRIQAVERLAGTRRADIQQWMLREGFRNTVMDEYLAWVCALSGGLHEALAADEVDEPLLDGARDLIRALVNGGPAPDIRDYEFALAAVQAYVRQIERHPDASAQHLLALGAVGRMEEVPWSSEDHAALLASIDAIQRRPWRDRIVAALEADAWWATEAASIAGVDAWDHHAAAVRAGPAKEAWYHLCQLAGPERVQDLVSLATTHLPLDDDTEEANHLLEVVISALTPFPDHGWGLLRTALNKRAGFTRLRALTVLEGWSEWPADVGAILESLAHDPDERVRERVAALRSDPRL